MKDNMSSVLLKHTYFGTPSFDDHYDFIGSLSLIYVSMRRDFGNVGGMGDIRRVDDYDVSGYIFKIVICYFLPDNSSKDLSY